MLLSVRSSILTSLCDEIPGFQNSLPGLTCVLQPNFIVHPDFKTLSVNSTQSFNQATVTDVLPVLQEISQNVLFKPQNQITRLCYYCFCHVGQLFSRSVYWTYSSYCQSQNMFCQCCGSLSPLQNNVDHLTLDCLTSWTNPFSKGFILKGVLLLILSVFMLK